MGKLRSVQDQEKSFKKMAESIQANSKGIDIKISRPPAAEGSKSLEEALAHAEQKEETFSVSEKVFIPLSKLQDSPYQPRLFYPDEEIQELALSLQSAGLLDPIRVRPLKDAKGTEYFELLDGHRRTRAARLIGLEVLNAVVEDKTDTQAHIYIATNIETRKDLSEWERAKMYQSLLNRAEIKNQHELSKVLACSRARISQVLTAIKLPEEIQTLFNQYTTQVKKRVVQAVAELIEDLPDEIELITKAVKRVFVDGAPIAHIKLWVHQQLSRNKHASLPRRETLIITNKVQRPVFSVKTTLHGEIVASISKGNAISHEDLQKVIVAALRAHVDKMVEEESSSSEEENVNQVNVSDGQ
jgi:ParB/RepB/Spo0J family partition protein